MCTVTLLLFVGSVTSVWAPPGEIVVAVDAIAEDAIKSDSTIGLSIAVAEGDELLYSRGHGLANVELESAATAATVYRIGSITKQFTAAAVLLLAEAGKLELDDPLSKHLPDLPIRQQEVTIRNLLQHTSGVKSFTELPSYRGLMQRDVSHDDILARIAGLPLQFEPGEQYRYSNSGFYLLGIVIEKASGRSYEDFLQHHIFTPLEMDHTYYDRGAKIIPGRAQGYTRWGGVLRNARYLSMTQPFAAGALASTAEDLVLWQRALVNHRLLSEESFRQMTTPGALANGKPIEYGLGTLLRKRGGRLTIGHGGGINGFRSSLVYYPETKHTIVVLANSEGSTPDRIARQVAEVLLKRGHTVDSK